MKWMSLLPAIFFLSSCFRTPSPLEQALEIAGNNRPELEEVLAHYKNEGDVQKLEAARYLIENMPWHFSYSTNRIDDYYTNASPQQWGWHAPLL